MTIELDRPETAPTASPGDDRPAATHSLNAVRAIVPEPCYRRPLGRGLAAVAQALVLYALPVTGLVLTNTWWAVLLLWVFAGFGVAGLFVIGHDASHQALFESRRLNRNIAKLCMAPSGHVEAAWDLGHNRIHHGYTARQGFDFVWHPTTPEEWRSMSRFGRLRHRLEWSCIGSGAYYLRTVWWEKMWRFDAPGKRRGQIRRDKAELSVVALLAFGGTATAGALTGGLVDAVWLPVKLLVVPFLLFVHVIGWTVYVHHVDPEITWWERKAWSQFRGQMESTTVLRLPRLVNVLWFHNIFVHVPHHVDARIPFHQLPTAAKAMQAAYPGVVREGRLSLRSYVRAARACKLYDFPSGTWQTYRDVA